MQRADAEFLSNLFEASGDGRLGRFRPTVNKTETPDGGDAAERERRNDSGKDRDYAAKPTMK
jgi:hypothetical protein